MSRYNLLVLKAERRRLDFAFEYPQRFSIMAKVVWPPAAKGYSESGISTSASRSSDPLRVIEGLWRNVPEEDSVQVTQINTQFKCC